MEHPHVSFEVVRLTRDDATLGLVPERGALVASLVVSGREVLYLDQATLDDATKNVRGGIPVLFPYAGKLVDGRFVAAGTTMKQHGFGRNRPWVVEEKSASELRARLVEDADTQAQYPYTYEADYLVTALPRGLEVRLFVRNTGAKTMPLSPGWHPYFRCPAALKSEVTGNVEGFTADKLGNDREFDFGLLPPASGKTEFQIPELGRVSIDFSPGMRHMQFWSLPSKDFICLEPFFGPNDTINTERRLDVLPGKVEELWMRIELDR
jgi:galactose mutarotase-like enzyme